MAFAWLFPGLILASGIVYAEKKFGLRTFQTSEVSQTTNSMCLRTILLGAKNNNNTTMMDTKCNILVKLLVL
jgi:hypothetical protein